MSCLRLVKVLDTDYYKMEGLCQANSSILNTCIVSETDGLNTEVRRAAPEVLRERKFSFQSDMYALGTLLLEIENGQMPFQDCSQEQIFHAYAKVFR